ncbi:MAG: hypothetical protein OXP66_00710, partial [Candidatus Tectomicrobia bacterium]|nr:hypothetical protein [Candidatus Tectomicrobia bacterium]
SRLSALGSRLSALGSRLSIDDAKGIGNVKILVLVSCIAVASFLTPLVAPLPRPDRVRSLERPTLYTP